MPASIPWTAAAAKTRTGTSSPIEERARQMNDHGLVGRRYAGEVKQIISGSIGFDDWEWGVDLFADEPLVFKKLIYEMRFDEVSAVYALFGHFYVGVRVPAAKLGRSCLPVSSRRDVTCYVSSSAALGAHFLATLNFGCVPLRSEF